MLFEASQLDDELTSNISSGITRFNTTQESQDGKDFRLFVELNTRTIAISYWLGCVSTSPINFNDDGEMVAFRQYLARL